MYHKKLYLFYSLLHMQQSSKALSSAKFDEKLGFTTRFREVHDSGWYMCRPKDQTEPDIIFEITLLPSCESTFSNLFTNLLRFGGVNNNNRNKNYVNKCFTWRQWWKSLSKSQSNSVFVKRDLLGLSSSKNKKKGFWSNIGGGGGGYKREALHVNDRPRPGFDYVDEEDDKGNDTTAHESLGANNNNLTSINNSSETVMNGTAEEGV